MARGTDRPNMTIAFDWDVKNQTKQTINSKNRTIRCILRSLFVNTCYRLNLEFIGDVHLGQSTI